MFFKDETHHFIFKTNIQVHGWIYIFSFLIGCKLPPHSNILQLGQSIFWFFASSTSLHLSIRLRTSNLTKEFAHRGGENSFNSGTDRVRNLKTQSSGEIASAIFLFLAEFAIISEGPISRISEHPRGLDPFDDARS